MVITNEDRFPFDQTILWLDIKLSTFCDLLAFSLLLGIDLAVFLYQISDVFDCFLCVFKGFLETGVLSLDIDHYLKVILLLVDFVLHEEGDLGACALGLCGEGEKEKDEDYDDRIFHVMDLLLAKFNIN